MAEVLLKSDYDSDPIIRASLKFMHAILSSISANHKALTPNIEALALSVHKDVSKLCNDFVKDTNAIETKNVIDRERIFKMHALIADAKVSSLVNSQPLVAQILDEYTRSVISKLMSDAPVHGIPVGHLGR